MNHANKHILLPLLATALFFADAAIPVELVGCRNRGLIAVFIGISAGIMGVFSAIKALGYRVHGKTNSYLWVVRSLIFAIPAIFIVAGLI